MNVILGYASLHNFEKYYKEYGEIIFEILLHNANENSSIAINLLPPQTPKNKEMKNKQIKHIFILFCFKKSFVLYRKIILFIINYINENICF